MTLAERERRKYEKVWAECELYHRSSPGLRHIPEAYGWFVASGWVWGDSIVDFGCGDGRALKWLDSATGGPAYTHGIDIAHSKPHRILQHCLWNPIPWQWWGEWGFCCDVLEHIPTEKVEAVLANIRGATRLGTWMQVALFEDTAGTMGDWGPLHLTVKPHEWWLDTIRVHWEDVEHSTDGKRSVFLLR